MWSSRKQDQRIGAIGELPRESRAAGEVGFSRASRNIVAFVDYNNIPPCVLEIIPLCKVALQRIDGNDAAIKIIEWVVVGRNAVAHPGKTLRVFERRDHSRPLQPRAARYAGGRSGEG